MSCTTHRVFFHVLGHVNADNLLLRSEVRFGQSLAPDNNNRRKRLLSLRKLNIHSVCFASSQDTYNSVFPKSNSQDTIVSANCPFSSRWQAVKSIHNTHQFQLDHKTKTKQWDVWDRASPTEHDERHGRRHELLDPAP